MVRNWGLRSEQAGKPWIVNFDELGPHWKGVMPDSYDASHDTIRHLALWGALMTGSEDPMSVQWFNPREGGELLEGSVKSLHGKGFQHLGVAPVEKEKDWLAVILKI